MPKCTHRSYGTMFSGDWDPFVYVGNQAGADINARAARSKPSWTWTSRQERRQRGALPGGRHKRRPIRFSALLAHKRAGLARWICAWRLKQTASTTSARANGPHTAYDIDHRAGNESSGELVERLGIGTGVSPRVSAHPHENQTVFALFSGDPFGGPGVMS